MYISLELASEIPTWCPWCLGSSRGLSHYPFRFLAFLLNEKVISWSAAPLLHRSDRGDFHCNGFTAPRIHQDDIKLIINSLCTMKSMFIHLIEYIQNLKNVQGNGYNSFNNFNKTFSQIPWIKSYISILWKAFSKNILTLEEMKDFRNINSSTSDADYE